MGAERRPRHHLCRHAAARHRDHRKANGGPPIYQRPDADLASTRPSPQGMGLKIGDTHDPQCAGPRDRGPHRQPAQGGFHHRRPEFRAGAVAGPDRQGAACLPGHGAGRAADEENAMYMAVTDRFPNISTVRVKDAIAQVQRPAAAAGRRRPRRQPGHHPGGLAGAGGRHRGGQPRAALRRHRPESAGRDAGADRAGLCHRIWRCWALLTGVLALAAGTLAAGLIAARCWTCRFTFDARRACW